MGVLVIRAKNRFASPHEKEIISRKDAKAQTKLARASTNNSGQSAFASLREIIIPGP